jgi:hypothetical protein
LALIVAVPLSCVPADLPAVALVVLELQLLNLGFEFCIFQLAAQHLLAQLLVGFFEFADGHWLASPAAKR